MSCSKLASTRADKNQSVLKSASIQKGKALNITTLPELCQLAIFDHLPVFDLMHTIGQVCTKWRSLLPTACRRRQVLTIMVRDLHKPTSFMHKIQKGWIAFQFNTISDYYPAREFGQLCEGMRLEKKFAWSALDYWTLDQNDVEILMDHFPKIVTLDLLLSDLSQEVVDTICYLLRSEWSLKLRAINFWIHFTDQLENPNEAMAQLYSVLEGKPALKELTYRVEFATDKDRTSIDYNLPILPQLERLRIHSSPMQPVKFENAKQVAELKDIKIYDRYDSFEQMERNLLLNTPAHFAKRFTHIGACFLEVHDYQRLANTFVNLKSLKIDLNERDGTTPIEQVSLMTILAKLTPLKQMAHLHLIGDLMKYRKDVAASLPVLSSIKCLSLIVPELTTDLVNMLFLGEVFPNLHILHVNTWNRWVCDIEINSGHNPLATRYKKHLFRSYSEFVFPMMSGHPTLRTVVLYPTVRYSEQFLQKEVFNLLLLEEEELISLNKAIERQRIEIEPSELLIEL